MEATVTVKGHRQEGAVVVSLNRPKHHNALNSRLVRELTQTFQSLAEDGRARLLILTGNGRSFCAGADLQGLLATSEAGYDAAYQEGLALYDLMMAVSQCPIPVIGRVDGWTVGGGMGLVSCCDLVVASERARFGFSEVRLGLIPAIITPFVLSRIHVSEVRELYLTGERFGAQRALEIGLVDRVVGEEDLDSQVDTWLSLLLQGAPGAQASVKSLLSGFASSSRSELKEHTSRLFAERVVSDEGREGIRAFVEKRSTSWNDQE